MPLAPIIMVPAYRSGTATPWGGTRLATLFHKDIPDSHTGESLEVSAIQGLNSTDQDGTPLCDLIRRYGKDLVGTDWKGSGFPLLLKLLDAKQQLSVQVHPGDDCAALKEGQSGKAEAWVILHADPGARIVCGINEGVTQDMLRDASEQGTGIEALLRFVEVRAGDALYIPPGTVHAVGAGILLYEIQQTSDLTYRFYDWDRRNKDGDRRPLHIRQALEVTDLDSRPVSLSSGTVPMQGGGAKEILIQAPHFVTERYTRCMGALLSPQSDRFGILTALQDGWLELGESRTLPLSAGQTALLPATGEVLRLHGEHFLASYPVV